MYKGRQSPITLKKEGPPTHRSKSQLNLQEKLEKLEQKIEGISFSKWWLMQMNSSNKYSNNFGIYIRIWSRRRIR